MGRDRGGAVGCCCTPGNGHNSARFAFTVDCEVCVCINSDMRLTGSPEAFTGSVVSGQVRGVIAGKVTSCNELMQLDAPCFRLLVSVDLDI